MRNIFEFLTPRAGAPTDFSFGDVAVTTDGTFVTAPLTKYTAYQADGAATVRERVFVDADALANDGSTTFEQYYAAPVVPGWSDSGSSASISTVSYFGFTNNRPDGVLVRQQLTHNDAALSGEYVNVWFRGYGWVWTAPQKIQLPVVPGDYPTLSSVRPAVKFAQDGAPVTLCVTALGSGYMGGVWAYTISAQFGAPVATTTRGPTECMSPESQFVDTLNNVRTVFSTSDATAREGLKSTVLVSPSDPSKVLVLFETKIGGAVDDGVTDPTASGYRHRSCVFAALPDKLRMFSVGEWLCGHYTEPYQGGDFTPYMQSDSRSYYEQATPADQFSQADNPAATVFRGSARSTPSAQDGTLYFDVGVDAMHALVAGYQAQADAAANVVHLATTSRTAVGASVASFSVVARARTSRMALATSLQSTSVFARVRRSTDRVSASSLFNPAARTLLSARGTCVAVAPGETPAHAFFSRLAFNSAAVLDGKTYFITPEGLAAFSAVPFTDPVLAGVLRSANNMRCGQLRAVAQTSPTTATSMKLGGTTWYRYPTGKTQGGARAVLGRGAQGRTASFVVRALQGDVGAVIVDTATDTRFTGR